MNNFNPAFCDAPPLLRQYLSYLMTILGRSPRTVEGYYTDIKFFLRFLICQKTGKLPNIDELLEISIANIPEEYIISAGIAEVFDFLSFTMTERGNEAAARRRKVSSIKGFYKYISTRTEKLPINPMEKLESPRARRALPKYMTLDDSRTLLRSIDGKHQARDFAIITFFLNCGMRVSELVGIRLSSFTDESKLTLTLLRSIDGKHQARDFAIITFFLNCGMRVSELVGIRLSSFTDESKLTLLGKGNKERIVYLNRACLDAKQSYDIVRESYLRNGKVSDYYFLSNRGTAMTTRRVEQMLNEQLMLAGLAGNGITPHKLRHTAATLMYQYGNVDIRLLQEILGHTSLSTTEIYTHVSAEQLEQAAESSPLSTFKRK